MYAARQGYIDILRLLLEKGADVNMKDGVGRTALTYAAMYGHSDVSQLLMDFLATDATDKSGNNTLMWATKNGHSHTVRALLEKGIEANKRSGENEDAPLAEAARRGFIQVAEVLLSRGAFVDITTRAGWTPLMFAAQAGHVAIVKLLLEHGADVNNKGRDGVTPLKLALKKNRDEVVRLLKDACMP
jgi:ankyrin repeat protein